MKLLAGVWKMKDYLKEQAQATKKPSRCFTSVIANWSSLSLIGFCNPERLPKRLTHDCFLSLFKEPRRFKADGQRASL